MRPHTPQGGGEGGERYEVDGQVVWTRGTSLPTPEEKMRLAARAVPTDIVPINVTGMTSMATAIIQPLCPSPTRVATNHTQRGLVVENKCPGPVVPY